MLAFICLLILNLFSASINATLATTAQETAILALHNTQRKSAKSTIANLVWSSTLEGGANSWVTKCKWGHSGALGVGENVYATSVRNDVNVFKNGIASWVAEKADYVYSSNTCKAGKVCGHYTQVSGTQAYVVDVCRNAVSVTS